MSSVTISLHPYGRWQYELRDRKKRLQDPIGAMAELWRHATTDHKQLHEGASVTRGRKYVLRTDVMYWNRDA